MDGLRISDAEFAQFPRFIFDAAGISLPDAKKALVGGRLARRLQHHKLASYGAYFALLAGGAAPGELQTAVDLLTTNATYFFREARHFGLLREFALAARAAAPAAPFRVWSAASSSGEEAYSVAMVLADCLGATAWAIVASDISARVLARAGHIPPACQKRYCLKGVAAEHGTLLVERALRQRVQFRQVNLNTALPALGSFDVIFLRNVMIYFNADTKRQVVARVLSALKPGGHFLIGMSESLNDISAAVRMQSPSVYRKP